MEDASREKSGAALILSECCLSRAEIEWLKSVPSHPVLHAFTYASLSDSQTLILEHVEIKICVLSLDSKYKSGRSCWGRDGVSALFYHCSRLYHLPRRNRSVDYNLSRSVDCDGSSSVI